MNQNGLYFSEENKMSNKTPSTLSAILTVLVLIWMAILLLLLQMVGLNGASERQSLTAMGISLACQSIVIIFLGMSAARLTSFLIAKVNWNGILAMVITVVLTTTIGGTISFLVSVIAIPLAGIR